MKNTSIAMPNETAAVCALEDGSYDLVLCGSGVMGLAHIGVLQALAEREVRVNRVSGMSLGALIAAFHANGLGSSEITQLFLNRQPSRFKRDIWLGSKEGCQRMFCQVQDLLPAARQLVEQNQLVPNDKLSVLAYDLIGEKTVAYQGSGYDLSEALSAACSVPGLYRPVRKANTLLVDCAPYGCVVDRSCCHRTIVSRAHAEGTLPDTKVFRVDRWLHQREELIAAALEATCTPGDNDRQVTINTAVSASALCGCHRTDEAIVRIIKSGYDATMAVLSEILPPPASEDPAE